MPQVDSMEWYLSKMKRHSPIVKLIDQVEGNEPDEREQFMRTSISATHIAGHVPNDLHSLKVYLDSINAKGRDANGIALGYLEHARDEVKEARRRWEDQAVRVLKSVKSRKPEGQWADAINKAMARVELYCIESRVLTSTIEKMEAELRAKERARREKYQSRFGKALVKKMSGGRCVRINGLAVKDDIVVETGQPLAEFEKEVLAEQRAFKKQRNKRFQQEWNAYKGDKVFVPLEG